MLPMVSMVKASGTSSAANGLGPNSTNTGVVIAVVNGDWKLGASTDHSRRVALTLE